MIRHWYVCPRSLSVMPCPASLHRHRHRRCRSAVAWWNKPFSRCTIFQNVNPGRLNLMMALLLQRPRSQGLLEQHLHTGRAQLFREADMLEQCFLEV